MNATGRDTGAPWRFNRKASLGLVVVLAAVLMPFSYALGEYNPWAFIAIEHEYRSEESISATRPTAESPRTINPIHMLVIFTKFKGENPAQVEAPSWAKYLFDGGPGSIPYYFDEISLGQITVSGEYLPIIYELPYQSSHYTFRLNEYVREAIDLVDLDPSVDFARFDNDGPDGEPGSGDDDGFVDFIVLMPISRPYDFIRANTTGVAHLRVSVPFSTRDRDSNNHFVKIDKFSGCISTGQNLTQAVGLISHEYCHNFGVPDLYDTTYSDGETDSAGIGWWGFMSHGLLGWNNTGGPVAPCAYTRMLLGIIGTNNENLIDLYGVHENIRISDSGMKNGRVYRIWITNYEYFLLEHRRNDNRYCDRNIPKNGLLIWHVYERGGNHSELAKRCDLECPDGRFEDAGYPKGEMKAPTIGGDNLDFWAHDAQYAASKFGNLGDATDVFDGVTYTRFAGDTNPNSNLKQYAEKSTGLEIYNIRYDGRDMLFDVSSPPLSYWHREKFQFIGMGYQRFLQNEDSNITAKKPCTLYLLNYGNTMTAEVLVTVAPDRITVDDLSSLPQPEVQRLIEERILPDGAAYRAAGIFRRNIAPEAFADEMAVREIAPREIMTGKTPRWVQEVSLDVGEYALPGIIDLGQNYPNPFNSSTEIRYILPSRQPVTFEVFNVLGQKVLALERGYQGAGTHFIRIDADGLSTGLYLYRIRGETLSRTRKFLLLR